MKHAFTFTPSVLLFVECELEAEFDTAFGQLSTDGSVLMPTDNHGSSKKFGWVNALYGVSWQRHLQWPDRRWTGALKNGGFRETSTSAVGRSR
jgi:predicted 3-demethylubiquinone-9 3-methyltransferase (glyoxalase superfamily)